MSYAIRHYAPALVIRETDTLLSVTIYDMNAGAAVDLSGGVSFSLRRLDGTSASSGAATVSGDGFTASYTVPTGDVSGDEYGRGWRVEWTTAYGILTERAALVRSDLHCSVVAQDLLDEDPELYHAQWSAPGGALVPWDRFIFAAYKEFYGRLVSTKAWPWTVINPDCFRGYILNAALAKVYASLMTDANTRYEGKADKAERRASAEWDRVQLLIDPAQDGAGAVSVTAAPVVYLGGAPSMSRFGVKSW